MKRLMMFAAAALILATLVPQEASAQRGRGFAVGGGAMRVATIGGYRGGLSVRTAAFAPRYGVRGGVWRSGLGWGGAGAWRPGWRWGYPLAAGVIAASSYGGYGY